MLLISLVVLLLPLAEAVPSEVTGVMLSVVSGQAALMVNWTKPSSDSTIIRYEVEYGKYAVRWIAIVTVQGAGSLTTAITNLRRGTTYVVRVRAVSSAGAGIYTEPGRRPFVLLPNLPSQVTGVGLSVVSGQATIRVTWTKPSVEGTFTRYDVQPKTSSQNWGDLTTRQVTGENTVTVDFSSLQRGTTYNVRIRAVSNAGNGPYSAEATSTVPRLPSPVTGVMLSLVPGEASITVTWDMVISDEPIIRYEAEYGINHYDTGATTVSVQGADTLTVTITGLERGPLYVVHVRAVSDAGNGPYNAFPDQRITIPNGPGTVSDVNVTVVEVQPEGSIAITVTWSPPPSEVSITGYEVDYSEAGIAQTPFTTTALTATINSVSGKTYKIRVRALSAEGAGGWSTYKTIAPPSVPTGVAATSVGTSSVTVTWNNDGFNYRVSTQRVGSTDRTPKDPVSPPHTITGLDSNTGYTITVEAYSPLGQAGSSIVVYTLPEAPSNLNLEVVSSTVIRVTWTAPPNADRLTPLTYLISYQSEFDPSMEEVSTQPVELTGLHPFAEYTVSVKARNTRGELSVIVTGKSTTLSAAPSEPPRSVQTIDALKTHDSLTWTWTLPDRAHRNGIITSYFIIYVSGFDGDYQPVGNFTKVVDNPSFEAATRLTYTVTSLTPDTVYSISIAAVTSGGTGLFSTFQARRTNFNFYVSMLTTEVTSDTSTISWAAPEGGEVFSYIVYYGVYQIGTFTESTTSTTSKQLNSQPPEVPIEVSVIPKTGQRLGGSVSRIFFAREGVPTVAVKNVTVMRIDSVSLRVSWTPLSLHKARGWPLYIVLVDNAAGRTTRDTISRNTNDSTVDVGGLDPSTWYSVRVQVGTSAGTSEFLITDPIDVPPPTTPPPPPPPGVNIIAAVVVVIILLVIAIIITVVVIVLVFRFRRKLGKSFSPTQSESEVEIKGGKGHELNLSSLPGGREAYDSREDLEGGTQNGKVETNTYETVTTSMGAAVAKSDFASHVTMMHKERDSGFEKEYLSIINDPEGVEAIAKANKLKNRYINIHTFDHSRVVLTVPDDKGSDYINASYIDGYKRESAYIASQGPTPSTITDFWQMIVDHKAPVIVMLTKVEEKGKKKCEQYWEETLNTKVDKGRGIQVTTVKFTPFADYEVREFQVTSSSSPSVQPLKVKHFLYTAWPDHGVPQHPSSLVRFTHKVRRAYQNSAAPIIVHCSAGVGRTGTYLTIDAMMQRIREVADLNIYEFVVEMRSKRTFMVQNQDQYAFIHDALCDYITCGDTSVAAHELRRVIIEMEATDPKTKKSGFDQQFEFLGSLSKVPFGEDFKFSKKLSISKKNRFKDRFPYSNSHLHVPGKSPSNGSDYINASFVNSYSRKNAFIAAQTPLPSTVADFWELLWQFKPPTVVILTSADDDKDGADFWPTQEEGVADYGVVKVNHKATMPCSDYDRHTLEVVDKRKDKCTPHTLKLFHFTTWSADSAPHLSSLLDMMGEVEKNHVGSTKSITVACSDGMSRTGVFVSVMNEIERLKTENEVDLFQTIKLARSKRPYFVFTPEQYKLCFDILQAYLDSFDTYANFKVV